MNPSSSPSDDPSSPSDDAALRERVREAIRRLQQPAYTGANRCRACTLVNVAITGVLAVAGAVVWLPLGPGIGLVGLVSIYFRGYLIPGTPELTKRYFPRWLLEWFGKPATETEVDPATPLPADEEATAEALDPEAFLRRVAALTDSEDEDDLAVSEPFATEWAESMAQLRDNQLSTAAALAAVVDVAPASIEFSHAEDTPRVFASADDTFVGQWISEAALVADVAAATVLDARSPDAWAALGGREKGRILTALRVFVPACPTCEGPVTFVEDETGGCCWSTPVVVLRCESCAVPLMRLDQSRVTASSDA